MTDTGMEYIIYCRKSTDESSGKQTQSIPDQIQRCVEYAEKNGLKIKEKPKDFSMFEKETEIMAEDTDPEITNKRIFQSTRHLFIIKEQESAKRPHERPKWGRLIKMIEKKQVRGLLSYSPDRQCRNMLEGGELINFVDQGIIDLKYTNFHFEDSASGKMMLGIRFVFSKQYSDAISENVGRGNTFAVSQGKSMGKAKYGYIINEDGYHEPHEIYFPLIKKAFIMKLYEKKSDEYVSKRLETRQFRVVSKNKTSLPSKNNIYRIRIDPFYYGMFFHGDDKIDLRQANPYYQPVINEDEHIILVERYQGKRDHVANQQIKEENDAFIPLERGLVITEGGEAMTPNLPNKERFMKKLLELQTKKPKATLADVIGSNQIKYSCKKKESVYCGLEIDYLTIEKKILELLRKIRLDDQTYAEFLKSGKEKVEKEQSQNKAEIKQLEFQLGKIEVKRDEYIKNNMGIKKDENETRIYEGEKGRYEQIMDNMEIEIKNKKLQQRNFMVEMEAFVEVLQSSDTLYRRKPYVRKRKLANLLFSNITINKKKQVLIKVKPRLEGLFSLSSLNGADDGTRTRNSLLGRQKL